MSSDVAQLQQIAVEAYQHYVPLIGRPPAPMIADYIDPVTYERVWVASEDDVILGFIVMTTEYDHLLVENIAVRPVAQNRGVGGHLMDLAEARARRLSLPSVALYTNEVMTENLTWYAHRGYVETGRRHENGFRRVYLRKHIALDSSSQP